MTGEPGAECGRGVLHRGERFGRAHASLAVHDYLLVLRQSGERVTAQDLVLRDECRAGDLHDLPLGGLTHVHQVDGLLGIEQILQLGRGARPPAHTRGDR